MKKHATIFFDYGPSSHRDGVLEHFSKSSSVFVIHLSTLSVGTYIHPSSVNSIEESIAEQILWLNIHPFFIHRSQRALLSTLSCQLRAYSSIEVIYSCLQLKHITALYVACRLLFFNIDHLQTSFYAYYEPLRLNQLRSPFRIARFLLSFALQKILLNPNGVILISCYNSYLFRLFYRDLRRLPYRTSSRFLYPTYSPSTKAPYVVTCVAQLIQRKDPSILLRSLCHTLYPVHINYVGTGPLKQDLLLQSLNLNNTNLSVEFHDTLDNKQVLDLLSKSHAFVLPSLFDGYGFAAYEALRVGCFTIVSLDSGVRDDVYVSANSALFTTSSVSELRSLLTQDILHFYLK